MAECSVNKLTSDSKNEESETTRLFENATECIQQKAAEFDSDTLLYLYAHFKQAKEGPCHVSKPGFLELKGRQKWTAWKALGDMTTETAMKNYVTKVEEIDPEWLSLKGNNLAQRNNLGPIMSTLLDTDIVVPEHEKTLFDYVKEGNLLKLQEKVDVSNVNSSDETQMTLLHWACDRGHLEVVSWLITAGAHTNCKDEDGQTPLHYASSCGHVNVLDELIRNGARKDQADDNGQMPKDIAFNTAVKTVFDNVK